MVSSWNGAPTNVDIHHAKWDTSSYGKIQLVILCLNLVHILGLFHFLDRVVVVQRHDCGVKMLRHLLVRLLQLLRVGRQLWMLRQLLGWLRWLLNDHPLLLHRLALHVLEILLKVNCLENVVNVRLGPSSSGLNAQVSGVDVAQELVVELLQFHLVDRVHLPELLLIHLERQVQVLGILDLVLEHDVLLFEVGRNSLLLDYLLTVLTFMKHVAHARLAVVLRLLLLLIWLLLQILDFSLINLETFFLFDLDFEVVLSLLRLFVKVLLIPLFGEI